MKRSMLSLCFTVSISFSCSDQAGIAPVAGGSGAAGSSASTGSGNGGGGASSGVGAAGAGGSDAAGSSGMANSAGAAGMGTLPPEPPAPNLIPDHHLGAPFRLVDGVIRADSNEYGLQASMYAIISATGATLEVTRDTGEFCLHGEVARVAEGPFGGNFAGFGLITGENVTIEMPGLPLTRNLDQTPALSDTYGSSGGIRISPQGPVPWDLGGGRVIGISARVHGSVIPEGPGGQVTPGGFDPDGAESQYGNCDVPGHPAGSDERRVELVFPALHYYCWNTATLPYTAWSASSTIVIGWGVGSIRVPGVAQGDPIAIPPDPYDFCFSDLRPVVLGAGPDDPGSDAGAAAADAGAVPDAGDAGP